MTTVLEGTLWAPMALRTICSTVAIFTKAVARHEREGQERDEGERDDERDGA